MTVDVAALAQAIRRGERRALSRGITLCESTRDDDQQHAQQLVEALLPFTGKALRVGISGTPGVGKSSLIEALGCALTDGTLDDAPPVRVAVLAVDPSSPHSGGSILGDKTRMEELSRREGAFIRPSPTSGVLGGVARRTREALLLCEAAGYDVVLVETVGVGQSEAAVADLTDTFVLLVAPGGGDELQGVKRGVLELVDVLVVNKADGDNRQAAAFTATDYQRGLSLLRHRHAGYAPRVLSVSAKEKQGLQALWQAVREHRRHLDDSGALSALRGAQAERWLWRMIDDALLTRFKNNPAVQAALPQLLQAVRDGARSPAAVALELLSSSR